MQRQIVGPLVVVTLAALAGTSVAGPIYSRPLDEYTLGKARIKARALAAELGDRTAEQFMVEQPIAITDDMSCPGIDIEVVNASDHTMWNVELVLHQKKGKLHDETERVHIPFLEAETKAKFSFPCYDDGVYRSRYSYDPDTLEIGYYAFGKAKLALALADMVTQTVDATLTELTVRKLAGTRTMLVAALAMADSKVAKELVAGIAATGIGGKELGDAILKDPDSAVAAEVAAQITKLPPAQQVKLVRALLASTAAEQWQDKLLPLIDQKLCRGARPDVVGLWIMAQNPKAIPSTVLRERVAAQCKLLPSDGAAFGVALDRDPQHARAVDAIDPAMFTALAASWKAKPLSPSLFAFVASSLNEARFDTAIALVPSTSHVDAITAIVESDLDTAEKSTIASHKAAWIAAAVAKLSDDDAAELVPDLFTRLVEGKIVHPTMRDAVRATKSRAPQAADGVLIAYADEHSKVYDVKQLAAAGIDPTDFLAFASTNLEDCDTSLDTLTKCMTAIATNAPLVKAGGATLRSEFRSSLEKRLGGYDVSKEELIETAKLVHAAGISVEFVVDRLCNDVRDAIRYNNDFEAYLEYVKRVPGGEACLAEVKDEAAAKQRNIVIMTILAIVGLIAPFPVGWFFMRRRFRKMKAALPVEVADETRAGARLDDRLGAAGLGRALAGAVAEARRETKLRGLDAIDPAMIERVAGVVRRAVKSGDAASLLARVDGQAIYIVALPVRHARPQVVQRYLGAEWPEHVEQIRAATGGPITALVVLCGPDAAEATLLVGAADGTTNSDPDALLDAREARDRNANTFRGVMALATAAAASPSPAAAA